MARITIFLLLACAFGYSICSESTSAASEKLEPSKEHKDNKDVDVADRRNVYSSDIPGVPQRPQLMKNVLPVECHVCSDCPNVNEETPLKLCPYSSDPRKRGKCVTYAEKYKHMQRTWYIRGCASERGSCDDIRRSHENFGETVSLLSCVECEGDKCNRNGASTLADYTIAFITLIVTPFISKATLS
uniref:Seminal protein n=1 Tax=Pieris rapae TaxID=64459 RepID=A0A220K8J6_PIERA|nr:seminal protein [Pieris rapae]